MAMRSRRNTLFEEPFFRISRTWGLMMDSNDDDEIPSTTTPETTDRLIGDELFKLSLVEREKVYEDIHGVSSPIGETPELVQNSLKEMQQEMDRLEEKDAYDLAKNLSEEYVSDKDFRIKFLRAESFDAKKAAERFANYFQSKLMAFGKEKLVHQVTADDLTEEDLEILTRGTHQMLPSRDTQGRPVFVSLPSHFVTSENTERKGIFKHKLRAFWYLFSTLSDDEETQKKGYVHIFYTIDADEHSDLTRRKLVVSAAKLIHCLPIRLACFHYCHNCNDPSKLVDFIPLIATSSKPEYQVRIRLHQGKSHQVIKSFCNNGHYKRRLKPTIFIISGTHTGCQYKLMSFGIPMNVFPMSLNGKLKTASHLKWIERRKQKELYMKQHSLPIGAVDIPSRNDVLLGRGRPFNIHPGNRLLHEIVESHFEEYDCAERTEKTRLAKAIVATINRDSGRFLKQHEESGMWVEVSETEARQKVNHSFRRKREFDLKAQATKGDNRDGQSNAEGGGKRMKTHAFLDF